MDTEKAKATIRKLLNLANDKSAAEGEIENAMRFASRLMEQHQLSDEDLSEVDAVLFDLEQAAMNRDSQYVGSSKLAYWEGAAAMFVCKLIGGVECYQGVSEPMRVSGILQLDATGNPQVRSKMVFYGVAEDVEIARQVFAELITTIAAMARLKWGGVYRGDGRQYCEGFVTALNRQLKNDASKQRAIAESSDGTALVAVQSRLAVTEKKTALAKKWLRDECGIKLGSTNGGGGYAGSNEAFRSGLSDGQRHSVSADRRQKPTAR